MDADFRSAAFSWLAEQAARYGDVILRGILQAGFVHRGEPITFMGQPGIWKPRVLELPLSITSVPSGPYDDSFTEEGFLAYRYRGTDPQHRDNVGLRELCRTRTPLVYFHGVARGRHESTVVLPSRRADRPDRDRLAWRYERFRAA